MQGEKFTEGNYKIFRAKIYELVIDLQHLF
jgi:hypothetical protein